MNKTFKFPLPLFLIFIVSLPKEIFSQNVGIGVISPARAKLEVHGVSGAGNTSAIFGGDGNGISFQRNWPTIGFNQYRDNTAGNGRYMANGYAAIQTLDPVSGTMLIDIFSEGTGGNLTNAGTRALTIGNNGNIGIRSSGYSDISLFVPRLANTSGALVIGGTVHNSRFCYSGTEDTYIRGGKDASTVFINDIAFGNIQLGSGSSKVGINTLPYAPAVALEINGALSFRSTVHSITSANHTITVGDRSFISVYNGSQPSRPKMFLTNGLSAGQMLMIHGDVGNGTSGFLIADHGFAGDQTNTDINGTLYSLDANNTMSFIWTGTIWVELCRSTNAQ